MTIASQTSRIAYTGDNSTTAFAVPFFFAANADLVVTVQDLAGNVTTKLLGTDYNLTGATLSAGGTCTFTAAPATSFKIAITRTPQITQTTSYNNNDPFPAKSHESALDKLTTIDQYLKSQLDRTIMVASTDNPPMTTLPPASVRALKNLSFDSLGNPSASQPVSGSVVSSAMIPVTTASTTAIARTNLFDGTSVMSPTVTASTMPIARAAFFDSTTVGANEGLTITTKGSGTLSFPTGATGHVTMGSGSFSGDDSCLLLNRALTPASGLLNSHGLRDETIATQAVTGGGFSGYSCVDAAATIAGTATTAMNHYRNFQARGTYSSTGSINEFAGLWVGLSITSGTAVNMYGVHVIDAVKSGAGAVTNNYGFYSDSLTAGASNYFLFQGGAGNPSALPGNLYVGGRLNQVSVEVANIQYTGISQFGLVCHDTNSVAGGGTQIGFYRNTVSVGTINSTLTTTAFNTTSDERLKNFLGEYDAKEAIRVIRADPVRAFEWKVNGSRAIGWGAQTSFKVSPDLATPGNDKNQGDEDFQPWGVDMAKRTPYLWAALSDALDRIDDLEKRLAAAGL